MKCRIAVFLSLCILFSVTGCRNKKIPVTNESLPSEGISETVEEMETTTSAVPSSEVTTTTTVKETTEASISSAETTNESTETTSVIPSESIRETTTSTTVIEETTAAPTATPTPQPTATPEPTATPTPTPEPTAIPTPTPEPEPEPEFDIEYWVQFEKDYVVQCGFELNPAAVHCWDTPLNANARCIYLERDIRGTIDYYASIAEEYDITMIWVWYEDLGGGEYQIYTGYA